MHPPNPNPYQFSNKLDIAFLNDLFEGDTAYAIVVFGDFLKDMPSYWTEIEQSYAKGNTNDLRAAIHKCKTLFGYVGHTEVLEIFQNFESKCSITSDIKELSEDFKALQEHKITAEAIINQEYNRLKQYHQSA